MPEILIKRSINLYFNALQNEVYLLVLMVNDSGNIAPMFCIFAQIYPTLPKVHICKNYLKFRIREI
jgi:hypothetical protein